MAKKKTGPLTEEEILKVLRVQAQGWLAYPNVTSVGVGPKLVDNQPTGELSIQVSVAKKIRALRKLAAKGFVKLPRFLRAPDGRRIAVDVVERSFRLSFKLVPQPLPPAWVKENQLAPKVRRRRRLARIMPGISVSHPTVLAGTIGAIVYDRLLGGPCILSNAHVLAGAGTAAGDSIVQPGSSDSADLARNHAGHLLRSHIGLAGDGAIASIEGRGFDETLFELGVAPRRLARAAIGDHVAKSGRTTGVTFGIVQRTGLVFRHDYGGTIGPQDVGGFEISIDPARPPADGRLCSGGDSGALWMIVENGRITDIAVGLHFAEQTDAASGVDFGLACNLHSVIAKLDVSLLQPT
ncbi:MAG: hypothetical protein ABIZ81_01735 [Opitutaceae bacterium]